MSNDDVRRAFDLTGRVAVITGGAGLLGVKHAEAVAEQGAFPVLLDIFGDRAEKAADVISGRFDVRALGLDVDITIPDQIEKARDRIIDEFGRIDILINNAANNPKTEDDAGQQWTRFENFPLEVWQQDISVGLTGAFHCSRVFGSEMVRSGRGVILNVASDLSVIGPDQRIYRTPGLPEDQQPVKSVTYSVVKAGLVGLTKYLATYWADKGVRVNAISPGGVYNRQSPDFVERLTQLIPLGRMADPDEYKAAIVFLVSDASSYMTGANVHIDGGRTAW